jgi:hypothetical protein
MRRTILQIQIRIHEEGALRNQRYAFTDRFKLVSELLQNARRAGATRIDVTHDVAQRRLRVADDGCGLDDFQHLLTLHESGWDEPLREAEHAFGVGFSKVLYATRRCIVRSHGRQIDFETAAALARQPIDVVVDPGAPTCGTTVELHGVDLTGLDERIAALCAGFPVDVCFNGEPVERPWAEGQLPFVSTPVGALHLCGTTDGRHSHDTIVFLQGFEVMRPVWARRDEVNVLHLDPRRFMARLPDRDKLIDEDLQRRAIDAALKAAWRDVLLAAKASLSPRAFVDTFYPVLRGWGQLELLNDLDELPASPFDEIVGYPIRAQAGKREFLREPAEPPTRDAIESGRVTVAVLDPMDDDNAARWMFARARGWTLFDTSALHHEHWLRRHLRWLDEEAFEVEPIDVGARSTLEGRWSWPDVVLCRAVRIRPGGRADECVDIADAGVHHQGTLYIPDSETTGEPVRHASDFIDENDQFQDADLDADRDALADLLSRLRSVDPRATLDALIGELRLERYPVLHGRRFELQVGNGARGHAVALLA